MNAGSSGLQKPLCNISEVLGNITFGIHPIHPFIFPTLKPNRVMECLEHIAADTAKEEVTVL